MEDVEDFVSEKEIISNPDAVYELYGTVIHHGVSLNEGHYTTTAFFSKTRTWYKFDDEIVTVGAIADRTVIIFSFSILE